MQSFLLLKNKSIAASLPLLAIFLCYKSTKINNLCPSVIKVWPYVSTYQYCNI